MTEEQIAYMVSQFQSWQIPAAFKPYAGISYTPPLYGASRATATPLGAALFDSLQTDAMVRHLIDGLPEDV